MYKRSLLLKPSFYLALFLIFIHGAGVGIIAILPWEVLSKIASEGILIGSFIFHFLHYGRLNTCFAITGLQWQGEKEWLLFRRDGLTFNARLAADSLVAEKLCILHFKPQGKWFSIFVPLVFDALDPTSFRHLRVSLLG